MSQLPPAESAPHNADAAAPVVEPGFEVTVQAFWDKNRGFILGMCVLALVAIFARSGWQYYAESHEASVQEEYAKAADSPAKLAAFADANAGHALGGVAYLKLADDKFSAGDFTGAAASYQKAASSLKNEALLGRAKLGAAISQISGSEAAAGEAALKALSADPVQSKAVRAEASYHLASLAAAAGKADEAKKLVEQISRIDATSTWSQRGTILLTSLPADAAKPAATGETPSLTFKAPGK
jgi:predicted negative regulator of RcsB-dependent stress response